MNLIQQAVERAGQMERESKGLSAPPPLPQGKLHGVQSRSFRPTPMHASRLPLAALGLAVLAVVGGALLYVALVRTQGDGNGGGNGGGNASGNSAAPKLAPAHPNTALVAAAKTTAAPVSEAPTPANPAPLAGAASVVAPVAAPVAAAAAPAVASTRDLDDARATIESWARAWSERDVSGYLAHYGDAFTPERGLSRMAWEKTRRQMIERRHHIAVNVAGLQLERVSDSRIVARYVQDYAADAYRETGTAKRMVLEREASGWRIVAEAADTAGAASS